MSTIRSIEEIIKQDAEEKNTQNKPLSKTSIVM